MPSTELEAYCAASCGGTQGTSSKDRRSNKWRKLPACDSENASWKLTPRQDCHQICSMTSALCYKRRDVFPAPTETESIGQKDFRRNA